MSKEAIKQFGTTSLIMVWIESILKWWYATVSLNFFRLRISLCVPSGFGRKNIFDKICPFSCLTLITTPLSNSLFTSASIIEHSLGQNFWAYNLCWIGGSVHSMATPKTFDKISLSLVILTRL
jgi:hypothetical protein